jgi:cell division GTPase FtsZ
MIERSTAPTWCSSRRVSAAAPHRRGAVIASLASELGALTIAVVTKPFRFEGNKRQMQAARGLDELRECVDTVITIPNERLLATIARNTAIGEAFTSADDVLRQAIQGISDLILVPGMINLDFADVKTIMSGMGFAIMGTGIAEGRIDRWPRRTRRSRARCSKTRRYASARGVIINVTIGRICPWSKSAKRLPSSRKRHTKRPISSLVLSWTNGWKARSRSPLSQPVSTGRPR